MRRRRINPFLTIAFTIILVWFAYLGHQLVGLTALDLPVKVAAWLILALPFGAVFWLPFFHWRDEDPTPAALRAFMTQLSYLSMGYLSLLLFTTAVRDLTWAVTRDDALYGSLGSALVLIAAGALTLAANQFARRTPRVKHVKISLQGLPASFEGYRIVQLSDIHISATLPRTFLEGVVARVNELGANLVVLTGDIFEGDVADIKPNVEPLSRLKATDGRLFVTGNHEYYWGADQWLAELPRLGFKTLANSHTTIARGADRIVVAGVNDLWASGNAPAVRCDPAEALAGAPSESEARIRILLAHQPKTALKTVGLGYALQLSGHTHGGQFLPWVLFAPLIHRKFFAGLSRHEGMWVYVSRGTGFWGPPLRLGSPSEITVIELYSPHR